MKHGGRDFKTSRCNRSKNNIRDPAAASLSSSTTSSGQRMENYLVLQFVNSGCSRSASMPLVYPRASACIRALTLRPQQLTLAKPRIAGGITGNNTMRYIELSPSTSKFIGSGSHSSLNPNVNVVADSSPSEYSINLPPE